MESGYILNHQLKRIEPSADTPCMYCENGKMEDPNHCYYIEMYSEQNRTNLVIYKSVKFLVIKVGVPRCATCYHTYDAASGSALKIASISSLILLTISSFVFGLPSLIISIPICVVFCVLFYGFLSSQFLKGKIDISDRDAAIKSKNVQDFAIAGWSFERPSA